MAAGGDCFEVNGRFFMNQNDDSLVLVHGEVEGQGTLSGVRFSHCWVEDGEMVLDFSNGRTLNLPKIIYYKLGKIGDIDNMKKYKKTDFLKRVLKHKHWGPWDLETSSGL